MDQHSGDLKPKEREILKYMADTGSAIEVGIIDGSPFLNWSPNTGDAPKIYSPSQRMVLEGLKRRGLIDVETVKSDNVRISQLKRTTISTSGRAKLREPQTKKRRQRTGMGKGS